MFDIFQIEPVTPEAAAEHAAFTVAYKAKSGPVRRSHVLAYHRDPSTLNQADQMCYFSAVEQQKKHPMQPCIACEDVCDVCCQLGTANVEAWAKELIRSMCDDH